MANAIKKISVQRGYDVTRYLLNCFGGAGGQHACLVADALGMESILIHPFSGLLSAYGIGLASVFASRQQALIKPLEEDSRTDVKLLIDVLCKGVFEELESQGVRDDAISWRPMLQLRYDGTDTTIPVAFSISISQQPAPISKPRTRRSSALSTTTRPSSSRPSRSKASTTGRPGRHRTRTRARPDADRARR
jgi:N-methylhydantoinase A/oxoprolinase/acetone carboxylase beta subunit